jgi:hypothetical protein
MFLLNCSKQVFYYFGDYKSHYSFCYSKYIKPYSLIFGRVLSTTRPHRSYCLDKWSSFIGSKIRREKDIEDILN